MYFELSPKTNRSDLFGCEYNLDKLVTAIKDNNVRFIVIKGLRRTGKTSLLNVALKESKYDYTKIDARESPFFDYNEFITYFKKSIKSSLNKTIISDMKLDSLSLGNKGVSANINFEDKDTISHFLKSLDKELKKKKKTLVIAIDEVQILKSVKIDYLIASIYDNYKNIKIIITGSEIGLVNDLLGEKNYDAPLYGRESFIISTTKVHPQETINFLEEGFKQIKEKISSEEIKDVIETLDGIIGWSTHYGAKRASKINHKDALEDVITQGTQLTKREFNNFLEAQKAKDKYSFTMKFISRGSRTWSEIKKKFIREDIKISDRQLNLYLNKLKDYGFIENKDGKYYITDPLLDNVF